MYFDNTGLAVVAPQDDPGLVGIDSEYVQTHCILSDGGDRFGVSALTFDKHEELLWMGNQGGHVTSYMAPTMSKYTSFQIHPTEDVRQIVTIDEGIIVLTASTLRYQIRRGIPIYTHVSPNMNDMQCMLQMSPHRILIGGHQDKLIDFNVNMCKETMVTNVGDVGCVMLRPHNRFVCAGNPLGRIDMRDPNTLKIEHSVETHTGSLSDFDVQGNLLVTCGFSNRHNTLSPDRFLMVYDLRMLRVVSPMQTVLDPFFLKFIPSISSRLAVVSALGQVQLLDTIALAEPRISLLQMENPGAMCLTFDVSGSGQSMACGDNTGHIHVFSNVTNGPVVNSYSRPCEMPDTPTVYPSFSINDYSTPLSVIPMPILPPDIPLSSDWPAYFIRKVYRKPAGIDPEILRTMKIQGPIGYAPNPKTSRRNQVPYNSGLNSSVNLNNANKSPKHHEDGVFVAIPKRYRKIDVKYNKLGSDDFQFDQYNKTGFTGLEATLPNSYCNSMIQVLYHTDALRAALMNHLCTKEFCLSCELGFLFHMLYTSSQNQPCQPGNFLRAFRTVPEASALGLILSDLNSENKQKVDLAALVQSWNRFILHQVHVELVETKKKEDRKFNRKSFVYKDVDFPSITGEKNKERRSNEEIEDDLKLDAEKCEEESEISKLFGSKQLHLNKCLKCSNEVRKESMLLSCNLIYPSSEPERDEWSFSDILERSLCVKQVTPAWCEKCNKFSPTSQVKTLQCLPDILAINTGLHHAQNKQFWQSQMDKIVAKAQSVVDAGSSSAPTTPVSSSKPCRYGDHCSRPGCRFRHSFDNAPPPVTTNNPYCSNNWLPHCIELDLTDEKLAVRKVNDNRKENVSEMKRPPSTKLYRLSAVVCYVNDQSPPDKRNLVSLVRVPSPYFKEKDVDTSLDNRWYLFNDFSISPIPTHEVVWFSLDWKIPCVLYYSYDGILNTRSEIEFPLSREVFTEDACIARTGNAASGITFTPLYDHEVLKSGDLVAMDAEFVTLNQEEAELRSDGKMSTVKPSQMSVARITCIRGHGPMEGTPFIDDYISTQEQVVDYLTKFSGIKPGDLDANFSSKHLTTLKSTYTKLRYLLDSGVIFVGHGLKNDFRVINMVVPACQIADTVHLFHLPHHRMVSLRFLAWHFLGTKIQSETHDSIEDARAALQLYKKYKQLEAQNKIGEALAELYETGKVLNWKVPED